MRNYSIGLLGVTKSFPCRHCEVSQTLFVEGKGLWGCGLPRSVAGGVGGSVERVYDERHEEYR